MILLRKGGDLLNRKQKIESRYSKLDYPDKVTCFFINKINNRKKTNNKINNSEKKILLIKLTIVKKSSLLLYFKILLLATLRSAES